MKDIQELIAGFRRFQSEYYDRRKLFARLTREGQAPRVMVIACCDSRVDPAIITDCDPGDLFVVRNVANLVPPCETGGNYHGTSAALEFAVRTLHVEHVIVLGHASCGGIRALLAGDRGGPEGAQFVGPWMSIAEEARREALAAEPQSGEEQARACELASIRVSVRNLESFPFVKAAVAEGALALHGWYFDLVRGELLRHAAPCDAFEVAVPAGGVSSKIST